MFFFFFKKFKRKKKKKGNRSAVAPFGACDIQFERLTQEGNNYYINKKVDYKEDRTFKKETIEKVLNFAYQMTFGGVGEHRAHRSGGIHNRKNGEIFADAFQGKLAECAASNFFYELGVETEPDFSAHKLGVWDTVDLSVGGKEISIKSTKHYGHLLLLETKEWDENAVYIPNKDRNGATEYDVIILIRLSPSCEDLMKSARRLYSQNADLKTLRDLIFSKEWSYQCVGYITKDDLKLLIKHKYILPQKAMLNGKTSMDADNYYVQAGCLRSMDTMAKLLEV